MKVVVDTNVLVTGLLTPHGPPGRILDLVLWGDVVLCFDDRVLAEYREVLLRPRFGFGASEVERVLDYVEAAGARVIAPPLQANLPDLEDRMFLEVAAAAGAEYLITGNLRHFPAKERRGVRVVAPREFIERWTSEK